VFGSIEYANELSLSICSISNLVGISLNLIPAFIGMLLIASHLQHLGSFSVSLKNIVYYNPAAKSLHLQHSIYGLHVGFSHTSSHLGLGHNGLEHFQSQFGSAQTDSHSGLGA